MMLASESDYEHEAKNLTRARAALAGLDDVVVPEVISNYRPNAC
ncbi:MAG: putative unusual protein kinase regulating ubiquinone biosynthesis (AarF/ABC1/UbiB family) [Planctomycetota bacterium]